MLRVFIKPGCPWCVDVERYLKGKGIAYESLDVSGDREAMAEMKELSGQTKAPTVELDGEVLADCGVEELVPWLEAQGIN